jgi:hypothetical protein
MNAEAVRLAEGFDQWIRSLPGSSVIRNDDYSHYVDFVEKQGLPAVSHGRWCRLLRRAYGPSLVVSDGTKLVRARLTTGGGSSEHSG